MADSAKKTIELDLISRLDDFRKSIGQVPGITEKEARKAARLMEKAFKDASGNVKKSNKQDIGGGLKNVAEALGGPLGESAGRVEKLGSAFKALATPTGAAVVALAGGTLALGAFVGASVAAVLAADDLAEQLAGLNDLEGFAPIPPETLTQIELANDAVATLGQIARQAAVTLGEDMAPAVSHAATLLVKMGLMALDAFQAFSEGKGLARELAVFLVDELVDSFAYPIDGATRFAAVMGALAGALGQDELAAGLQGVRDTWEGISRSIAETAVDSWIGLAGDGVDALDEATGDYDARARDLIGTVGALADAEAGRAGGDKAAAERVRQLQEALQATGQLEQITRKVTASQLDGYAKVNWELAEQLTQIDELLAKGGDVAAAEQAQAAVRAQAATQIAAQQAQLASDMEVAEAALRGVVAELEEMERAAAEAAALEIKDAVIDAAGQLSGAISDVIGEALSQQLDAVSTTQDALAALGEDATAAERQALMERLEAQQEAATKLFRGQQAAGIGQAAIAGSVAILQALAQLGPIAGAVAAGAIGITTATQIGLIASQQPPEFHVGGIVGERDPSEVQATLRRGEGVLTRQGVDAVGGPAGLAAANRGQGGGAVIRAELRVGTRLAGEQFLQAAGADGRVRAATRTLRPSGRRSPYDGGRR